jgi:hypothetical protein
MSVRNRKLVRHSESTFQLANMYTVFDINAIHFTIGTGHAQTAKPCDMKTKGQKNSPWLVFVWTCGNSTMLVVLFLPSSRNSDNVHPTTTGTTSSHHFPRGPRGNQCDYLIGN